MQSHQRSDGLGFQSPFRAPTMIYLLGLGASAFSSPACSSRVALSRVAQPVSTARVPLPLMCDVPEEAPAAEAAAEPAADDSAEDKPARRARAPRAPKTKLEDLVTDVEIQGTVRSVQSYGAFVDIGAETDGLLHVSEISNEYVKDATEKLNVGDAVTVRVKMVNMEKKQARLTYQLRAPPPSQSSTRARRQLPCMGREGCNPSNNSTFHRADAPRWTPGAMRPLSLPLC